MSDKKCAFMLVLAYEKQEFIALEITGSILLGFSLKIRLRKVRPTVRANALSLRYLTSSAIYLASASD